MSNIPRRNNISKMTDAERAIYNAIVDVEALRADERLTEAVNLLKKAQNLVADFVDGLPKLSDREVGYYKVKSKKYINWIVACWNSCNWFTINDSCLSDSDFIEIGEKIDLP